MIVLLSAIEEKTNHCRVVSKRYHWPCMKEDIAHFMKAWVKCQMNRVFYQKQTGLSQPLLIPPKPCVHGFYHKFAKSHKGTMPFW